MLAVKIAGYYRHFNHQKHHYLLLPVLYLIAYLSIYFHKQPMFFRPIAYKKGCATDEQYPPKNRPDRT